MSDWIRVTDRMPESGALVLACYRNELGKWRRICACWIAEKTVESGADSEIGLYDEDAEGCVMTESELLAAWCDALRHLGYAHSRRKAFEAGVEAGMERVRQFAAKSPPSEIKPCRWECREVGGAGMWSSEKTEEDARATAARWAEDGYDGEVVPLYDQAALSAVTADYAAVLTDNRRLVHELDVLLNGEDSAARQASLCDIVSQVRQSVRQLAECSAALDVAGHPIEWQERIEAAVAAERERCAALFDIPVHINGEAEHWARAAAAKIRESE